MSYRILQRLFVVIKAGWAYWGTTFFVNFLIPDFFEVHYQPNIRGTTGVQ